MSDTLGSAPTLGASEPSGGAPAEPPSVVANRYTILGLLGAGGMGRVYRAHDRSLDEVVALKMLRRELLDVPAALDRFRQEVKLARRVTSPHVVRTYDLGEHAGDHFLTMEYVEGRSLARWLDEATLPMSEVMRVARATCAGMTAAHAAGVLHRDLKPDNVLVAKDGRIAITDFGLARASVEANPVEGFVGTPAYMAPEQVQGAAIGPAADVYAFGAILFELLTGERPFTGRDPIAIARARLDRPPPDPRRRVEVPDALAELVVRCLALDPAARFADGGALGVALAAIEDLRVTTAAAPPRLDVPVRTSRGVALLPLVADDDLDDVAAGLGEELVDALSRTRDLRVVPMATVRRSTGDARQLGRQLDVDVVVEGALRRRGDAVRLTARMISVADGFQLWASHFDAAPADLLSTTDDVARAIARALTVEIELPARAAPLARAVELYLEGKAKVRAHWFTGQVAEACEDLEPAAALAPDHAGVLASLSMAIARASFLAFAGDAVSATARATALAERAIAAAPSSGEAWLALGIARLYGGDSPAAAFAMTRTVTHAPGLALGQHLFGALLLEAGALADAIAHLEAATSIDPVQGALADLPRAYIYSGRWDDGFAALHRATAIRYFAITQEARFRMWRGEVQPDLDFSELVENDHVRRTQPGFVLWFKAGAHVHRTRSFAPGDREALQEAIDQPMNPRLRVARLQFHAEMLMFVGDHDAGLVFVERAIDAGLQDYLWLTRCPILEPLRERPRFRELEASLAARAEAVLAAVRSARA